jgi:hypothetical protein
MTQAQIDAISGGTVTVGVKGDFSQFQKDYTAYVASLARQQVPVPIRGVPQRV